MLEFSIITITAFVSVLDTTMILILQNFVKGDFKKIIPLCSIIFGVTLGIVGYYTKNVEMGSNLVEAIFIGISAGAAATGIDQVGKQLGKKDSLSSSDIQQLKKFLTSIQIPDNLLPDLPTTEIDEDVPAEESDAIDTEEKIDESILDYQNQEEE